MIRHVAGVGEIVEDLEKAVAFYRELGLVVRQEVDDYAVIDVPGVLHFGVWSRAAAALSIYGSRDAVDRIPLGVHVEFEVDDIDSYADTFGDGLVHGVKQEPWGQRTLSFISPSGVPCGLAETPWARELAHNVEPLAAVDTPAT